MDNLITSKQIIKFCEEYCDTINVNNVAVVVIKNPTKSEYIKPSLRDIRFLADNDTKDIYIWDAYYAAHEQVMNQLGFHGLRSEHNIYNGEAEGDGVSLPRAKKDATVEMYLRSDIGTLKMKLKFLKKVFSIDWGWVDKYIVGASNYIKQCEFRVNQRLGKNNVIYIGKPRINRRNN